MTPEQMIKAKALAACTFLPGSYQKRFVGQMALLKAEDELTPKQSAFLDKLYWQWRRQINNLRAKGWSFPEPTPPSESEAQS